MPSELKVYSFPRLKSAKRELSASQLDYKSGASFSGNLDGVQRSGSGVFSWPNGDKYSGEYEENVRNGQGEQIWADGSQFSGKFVKDVRHGYGEARWKNGESFSGTYFKDHRHGEGVYSWSDGSTFRGTFFKDQKEGYGVFTFPNGKKFEGLYRNNERCGPGVLTYPDGTQDVGLWHKERLINLCSATEGTFHLQDHEHIDYNKEEHVKFLKNPRRSHNGKKSDPRDCLSKDIDSEDCLSRDVGSGDASNSLREIMGEVENQNAKNNLHQYGFDNLESIDLATLTYDQEEYDAAFFGDSSGIGKSLKEEEEVRLINKTLSFARMQEHILLHSNGEDSMPFSVSGILQGDRGCHGGKGPIETASEGLITAAGNGDNETVRNLLIEGAVDVNVADRNGHTALLGAAVNMHRDIINLLLDNGADVNKLNNEGLSALAACHVLFYPPDVFKYNIAERYLAQPPEEDPTKQQSLERNDLEGSFNGLNLEERPQSGQRTEDLLSISSCATSGMFSNNPSFSNFPEQYPSHDSLNQEYVGNELLVHGGAVVDKSEDFFDVESHIVTQEQDAREDKEEIPNWDSEHPDVAQSEAKLSPDRDDQGAPSVYSTAADTATEVESETESPEDTDTYSLPEFDSNMSLVDYRIPVTEEMIERCATVMSQNKGITSGRTSKCSDPTMDEARRRAVAKAEHAEMESTIRLLLKRGADPNASSVPVPVIFFAIKAIDVDAVRVLLKKGALTTSRLSKEKDGLVPVHIASALRGSEGVEITRFILDAGADPNIRTLEDDDHEKINFKESLDGTVKTHLGLDESVCALYDKVQGKGDHRGGRTPLHIACSRDDDYELSRQVVRLLLERGANPNVLCSGQSPLSMAIASGNDLAVEELLRFGANPSLPLGSRFGSALCVASDTQYELRRGPLQRIALIDKLVNAGANILAPIPVGSKKQMGTAVDYAYWMFNQDRRIAHMPYHALTNSERDTYNARKKLLSHLGGILRSAAVQRERERLDRQKIDGIRSKSPSHDFLYTGAGAQVMPGSRTMIPTQEGIPVSSSETSVGGKQVIFHSLSQDDTGQLQPLVDKESTEIVVRKPLLKYCYECGRMLGVRLTGCTRCKEVYYCSKACKVKGWNARHKEECLRVSERSHSPSPSMRTAFDTRQDKNNNTSRSRKNSAGGNTTTSTVGKKSGSTSSPRVKSGKVSLGNKHSGDGRSGSAPSSGKKSLEGISRSKVIKAPGVSLSQGSLERSHGSSGSARGGKHGKSDKIRSSKDVKGGSARVGKRGHSGKEHESSQSQKDISENYSYN